MRRKYYAAHNDYGTNLTYTSIGWQFLACESKAARDTYVDEHCYNSSGNIVCEPIARRDIPTNSHSAIVKEIDVYVEYPEGCLGEIGDRYTSSHVVVGEL